MRSLKRHQRDIWIVEMSSRISGVPFERTFLYTCGIYEGGTRLSNASYPQTYTCGIYQ